MFCIIEYLVQRPRYGGSTNAFSLSASLFIKIEFNNHATNHIEYHRPCPLFKLTLGMTAGIAIIITSNFIARLQNQNFLLVNS